MRQVILLLTLLASLSLSAQEDDLQIVKGNCIPDLEDGTHRAPGLHKLPAIKTDWDATKTYKQLVVLVEFSDLTFRENHDVEFYETVFNNFDTSAYEGKKRFGQGSVADYFRTQSGGVFNLSFDIVGPYQVIEEAHDNDDSYKIGILKEATEMMVEDQQERDFTQYDWNGDGSIEQVIYVVAGPSGNVNNQAGYLHPNTFFFDTVTTADGMKISNYSASTEIWTISAGTNCGIGTICHEFSHSLGLPDIYPTNGWCFSVCDEWDLMDGGNFTNYGWCTPNFTTLEKNLLRWYNPIELTEPASITGLLPYSEGGDAYIIQYSDTEFLLLENRQWTKWDAGLPGKGLLVWYVDWDASAWRGNKPNNRQNNPRFRPVYADGLDYDAWKAKGGSTYQNINHMNSYYLSTSPFPYEDVNAIEEYQITNISVDENGLVSFDYLGGDPSAIRSVDYQRSALGSQLFDLCGRPVTTTTSGQMYIVRGADGVTKKMIAR